MTNFGKNRKTILALAAALIAMTGYAQEAPPDICAGNDAVAGTVNGIVEAGGRVYALTSASGNHPAGGGVYISCNGGDSWYKHPAMAEGGVAIAKDPADANTIYAAVGGGYVYVTRDAGETWVSRRPVEIGNIHVSALAALPGGQVYAGMGTGQLLMSSDYGSAWQSLNESLSSAEVRALLVDPVNTSRLLVTVGNEGVYQSLDGGQSFEQSTFPGLLFPPVYWDVRDIAFAPSNTSMVYAAGPAGLFLSVDGGQTFGGAGNAADAVDIAFGRRDPMTMFVVSEYAGVLRSTDGGQSFVLLAPELPRSTDWFRTVVQLESGRLLVGTVVEGIVKSDDDGATWQSAGTPLPPPPEPPPEPPVVTAALRLSLNNLDGGEAIEAGNEAGFRIVVRNDGPELSTDTVVLFDWVLPGTGGRSSKAFSLSSTVGSCVVAPDQGAGCTVGTLGVGQTVTIEFRGRTNTDFIGDHTLTVTARNAEGAEVWDGAVVASQRSILCYGDCGDSSSGGGGSAGVPLLFALAWFALFRRRRATTIK